MQNYRCSKLTEDTDTDRDTDNIFIFGAGGHSKVVLDALKLQRIYEVVGVFSGIEPENSKNEFLGIKILGTQEDIKKHMHKTTKGIIAFGHIESRAMLYRKLRSIGFDLVNVVHPKTIIACTVHMGRGNFFAGGVIVNPYATIGDNCIINTGSIIEHDCVLSDNIHMAPRSTLCGNVKVGSNTFIGAGATVIQGVTIGENVVVGAGAVVLADVPDNKTVVGVPANQL